MRGLSFWLLSSFCFARAVQLGSADQLLAVPSSLRRPTSESTPVPAAAQYASSFRHEFAVNVGETKITTLEAEGELFVVEAEQVQDRRVQVVNMRAVFDRVETQFVRLADDRTGLSRPRPRTTW
jgi:hypothetical protein